MPLLHSKTKDEFRTTITSVLNQGYSIKTITHSPTDGYLFYVVKKTVTKYKWEYFPNIDELTTFIKKEAFCLRQFVWTGTEWFAYFENETDKCPARKWSWKKSIGELEERIKDHLSNNYDLKVAAYGNGSWFSYHELCEKV